MGKRKDIDKLLHDLSELNVPRRERVIGTESRPLFAEKKAERRPLVRWGLMARIAAVAIVICIVSVIVTGIVLNDATEVKWAKVSGGTFEGLSNVKVFLFPFDDVERYVAKVNGLTVAYAESAEYEGDRFEYLAGRFSELSLPSDFTDVVETPYMMEYEGVGVKYNIVEKEGGKLYVFSYMVSNVKYHVTVYSERERPIEYYLKLLIE